MSYGASLTDALHVVGVYAGRILKGERSPSCQPSAKVELVINLKGAKTPCVIITFPLWLLGRAEE